MYAMLVCLCFFCKNVMTCNPRKVPSVYDKNGVLQPICLYCHTKVNKVRKEHGLDPWPEPLEGAYEACDEMEL